MDWKDEHLTELQKLDRSLREFRLALIEAIEPYILPLVEVLNTAIVKLTKLLSRI